jgi:Competence protein CoiA-like family
VPESHVPGLDLVTGLEVAAGDRKTWEWKPKGHNGDGTLVCLECYLGADRPDGPRTVPLVPRGKVGGARQPHFAHPPGMAPPDGHRSPESAWHSQTKRRLERWAIAQGAAARIEARTGDGRRRTDVSVTPPGGPTLAVEVQFSSITDAEIIARGEDYLRAGSTVVWVWRNSPPHVLYEFGQPGWMYDLDLDRIGLVCGKAHPGRPGDADGGRTLSTHWPPCSDDATTVRWMPLADLRLTAKGLCASEQVLTRLAEEATEAAEASRQAQTRRSSALPTTGMRRDEKPRHRASRPVGAGFQPDSDGSKQREVDPATARAQAWAAGFLDREIRSIEVQLAGLNESTRLGSEAAGQYVQGVDSEADVLANRLRILRMRRALLPEPPNQ